MILPKFTRLKLKSPNFDFFFFCNEKSHLSQTISLEQNQLHQVGQTPDPVIDPITTKLDKSKVWLNFDMWFQKYDTLIPKVWYHSSKFFPTFKVSNGLVSNLWLSFVHVHSQTRGKLDPWAPNASLFTTFPLKKIISVITLKWEILCAYWCQVYWKWTFFASPSL